MGFPCPGTGGNPYSVNKFARCCPKNTYCHGTLEKELVAWREQSVEAFRDMFRRTGTCTRRCVDLQLTTGCDTVRCDSECAHALRAARALSGVNPGKPHTPREGPPHHTYTRAPLLANTTAHIGPPVCEGGLNALISHEKATESDNCGNRKYNVAAIVVLLNEVIDDLLA